MEETFADLIIRIFPRKEEGYPVKITLDSGSLFQGTFRKDLLPWLSGSDPKSEGKVLFDSLFKDPELRVAWDYARYQLSRFRIRLQIDEGAVELYSLPWELLYENGFLSTNANMPFSRFLLTTSQGETAITEPPLKVLATICSPNDLEIYKCTPLEVELEKAVLKSAISEAKFPVELTFLDAPVTLSRLEAELRKGYHVLHIMAHGNLSERTKQTKLYLQSELGDTISVTEEEFANILTQQNPRLNLVCLYTVPCIGVSDTLFGLGPRLVQLGIPAVIGMRDRIAISTIRKLAEVFYQRLTHHGVIDLALNEARASLYSGYEPDIAVPLLFMHSKNDRLFASQETLSGSQRRLNDTDKYKGNLPGEPVTPNTYTDLEIRIFPRTEDNYPVEITLNGLEHYSGNCQLGDILAAPLKSDTSDINVGERLFYGLFVDSELYRVWNMAKVRYKHRRLRLWIDSRASELQTPPWELLQQDAALLAADVNTPFSRYLPPTHGQSTPVSVRPIRILVVISNPTNLSDYGNAPLDVQSEHDMLEAAFQTIAGQVTVKFLDPPITLERLETAVREGYHVLHYVGRSSFNPRRQQGALYLQDSHHTVQIVRDEELSDMLMRLSVSVRPHLVFLTTGQNDSLRFDTAFANLAPRLLQGDVPAIVVMPGTIEIVAMQQLVSVFYRRLTEHGLVDLALNEACATLIETEPTVMAMPQILTNLKDGKLFEVYDPLREIDRALAEKWSRLDLSGKGLTELPPQIGELSQLEALDLSNNRLTVLPLQIGRLSELRHLCLAGNALTTLPAEIGRLSQLELLDLKGNQLTSLPAELRQLSRLQTLDIQNNPLSIPPEISGPLAILNYYFELRQGEHSLNEAKVILVGQGGAGKTSLVNRLINDSFDSDEPKTGGIAVHPWVVTLGTEPVYLNVWDFGGQKLMLATHQFFFTHRGLYLLVVDARADEREGNLEHWLRIVRSFGGDSPIIVVINKIDEHPLELNTRGLRDKYPTIRAFVETSCKANIGIDALKRHILRELEDMKHLRTSWPKSWFAVKTRLSETQRDFITYDEYVEICEDAGITDPDSQRDLVAFLHDLGTVLNYYDDPRLEDTNVLNPQWVTEAVYKILTAPEVAERKGVLKRQDLERLLDRRRYPRSKYDFILRMMQKFEVCFPLEGDQESTYLIPDLFTKTEPVLDRPDELACLNFQYHYTLLPGSVISRFIVRMHSHIAEKDGAQVVWHTGVLLTHQDNQALVKADLEERRITIAVTGDNVRTRREFLGIVRSHFEFIHRPFSDIVVTEMVPIPGHLGVFVPYSHLLVLEKKRVEVFIPQGMEEFVQVRSLLDGIEPSEARRAPVGIPAAIESRLYTALLATGFFDEHLKLETLFDNEQLASWADNLPQTNNRADRVRSVVHYLHTRYRDDTNENALVILLRVLAMNTRSDIDGKELDELADELADKLRRDV